MFFLIFIFISIFSADLEIHVVLMYCLLPINWKYEFKLYDSARPSVLSVYRLLLFSALYYLNVKVEPNFYSCSCKSANLISLLFIYFGIPIHLVKHFILYVMECGCYSGCLTCTIVSRKLLIFVTLRNISYHFMLCGLEKLTQVLEAERDSQRVFEQLPFHYVEISRLLFDQ